MPLILSGFSTLKSKVEFDRVFSGHKEFSRNGVGIYFALLKNAPFRYGIVIPKRFGGAVERNKTRRQIKELIRLREKVPENVEIVICIYKSCQYLNFDLIKNTLYWALDIISRKAKKHLRESQFSLGSPI
ncbi:ribonuclease P protein component [bacterium]|nr:ribonuclease P protein component [bacterium]